MSLNGPLTPSEVVRKKFSKSDQDGANASTFISNTVSVRNVRFVGNELTVTWSNDGGVGIKIRPGSVIGFTPKQDRTNIRVLSIAAGSVVFRRETGTVADELFDAWIEVL